ncbi:MAG: SDR family NAD(P)-dependent oxidoreductase, partial [Loigolactobacillus coryniformis]
GALTNDAGTGKISLQPTLASSKKIARADVAAAIVAVLSKPQASGQIYDLVSGTTPIEQAF